MSIEQTPPLLCDQAIPEQTGPSTTDVERLVIMKAKADALEAENRRLAELARIEAENRAAQQAKLDAIAAKKAKEKALAEERANQAKQALHEAKEKAKVEAQAKLEAKAAEKARIEAEFKTIKLSNEQVLAEKLSKKSVEAEKVKEKAIEQLIDSFVSQLLELNGGKGISKHTIDRLLDGICSYPEKN